MMRSRVAFFLSSHIRFLSYFSPQRVKIVVLALARSMLPQSVLSKQTIVCLVVGVLKSRHGARAVAFRGARCRQQRRPTRGPTGRCGPPRIVFVRWELNLGYYSYM